MFFLIYYFLQQYFLHDQELYVKNICVLNSPYSDFEDDARPRTPKDSAAYYSQIVADNGFPEPELN